ncbi:DhkJ2 [Paenibacillus mucilaginosus 3016]|uniref:Circadian input-output histidine kinase CikA n=2 Tax=Paenibacillus mucilaginosus TaxID=61624 RepID=H6NRY1_9BACL|nr:response regulator [Paenibacillus mucilaginosus]AFC33610.1 DhkJ2 [Paenibacillus mucilaginosus 3016]AFH65937.2 histidine kinase [Paenibacillus mucilaginosus K02]WFA22010.1 response regulator [Paenibacillus mucilaginosus]
MPTFFRSSIRVKLAAGFIAVLICLGISTFVLIQRIYSQQQAMNYMISHDMTLHDRANGMEKSILDMETGQRGYVITGNSAYLEPYHSGREQWKREYLELIRMSAGSPEQLERLEQIRSSVEHWIESSGEPAIALKEAGRTEELQRFFREDPGKRDIDHLRSQLAEFREIGKQETAERAAALVTSSSTLKAELYLLLFAAILIALLVILLLSRSIVHTLELVTGTIRSIAAGEENLTTRIDVRSHDEIHDLAEATNALLARVEEENWLKTCFVDVATLYQGSTDIKDFAQTILNWLGRYMDAAYGAVYIRDEESGPLKFVRTAAYAELGEARMQTSFRLGEGLAGQAAAEQRMMVFDPLPDGYVRAGSGLGEAQPRSLILFPVSFEGDTIAVIELASFAPFRERHKELLRRVCETLGIALHSVQGRMEVERLYQESQVLTEELQTQTEELQAQSEELHSQHEELIYSNDALRQSEERLHWQKLTLEKQAEELAAISKYKSEFLANMSHELRTPLNSMLILSQLLAENRDGNLTEKQTEFALTIHASGSDLLRLIDEILDLSKVEAGRMKIEPETFSLRPWITWVERSFEPLADKKGLLFHIAIHPEVPEQIYTDSHRLQQILRNFLSNAFKFTSKGSVALRIDRNETVLRRSDGTSVPAVAFSVIDTGIGIPKNKLELIFEAFQQVDGTTSRRYGGTGLGLTISRELARLLGGTIRVESSEGAGSRFTLYLPERLEDSPSDAADMVPVVEAAASLEAGPQETLRNAPKRLLLVEQDPERRSSISRLIGRSDVSVQAAASAQEALDVFESSSWDGILVRLDPVDRQLPRLLERLEGSDSPFTPPYVLYTDHPLSSREEACLKPHAGRVLRIEDNLEQRLLAETRVLLSQPKEASREGNAAEQPPLQELPQVSFAGRQVLLVEDDIRNVFALSNILEKYGINVLFADNGKEALELLEGHPRIDLVLMDIMMPEMDGYQAIRSIRALPRYRQLPIIALSAKAMKEDRQRCMDAGASDYLSKPVDVRKLVTLLQTWLRPRA